MIDTETAFARICKTSPKTMQLLALLNPEGQETRIIGGAVRNALLGQPIHDIDVATTLLPETTIKLAQEAGLKSVPTGISHGTVTIIIEGNPFEVTTLRQDVETNGRHAKVEFTRNFQIDALRRDFTVNALSMDMTGAIYDYTDGLTDLDKQIIRFIGDPLLRIQEDYLRILRFFRFSASYGKGKLDKSGLEACLSQRKNIPALSRERIGHEMRKWLTAKYVYETIEAISSTGFLHDVLGVAVNHNSLKALINVETEAEIEPTFIRHLAALSLVETGTCGAAETLRQNLKLSNHEHTQLESFQTHSQKYRLDSEISESKFKQIIYTIGYPAFMNWLLVNAAEKPDLIRMGTMLYKSWIVPKNPFSGEYFIKIGLKPGPELGSILRQAERAWMDQDFTTDPTQLKAITAKILG